MACQGARSRARDLGVFNVVCMLYARCPLCRLGMDCMSPLYEPQLLTTEFANGIPQIPTRKLQPLNAIQRRYIYWGFSNKMPQRGIARMLGCEPSTVWRRIQNVRNFPLELLDSGFVQGNRTRNGDKAYFCRFCGYGAVTDTTVVIHAYEHLFGEGAMKPSPSPLRYA